MSGRCSSSSDDLGCYEFSGGFQCEKPADHETAHPQHMAYMNGFLVTWQKVGPDSVCPEPELRLRPTDPPPEAA